MEKEIKEFLEQHFNHTVDNYEFNEEDMNKLTNTLIEIGYGKDDIYSVVLSQMFDRSDLVKA